MHYIISATMRITLGTLMLPGVCLFVLLGLLSLIRELFADENHQAPTLADDESRPRDSRILRWARSPSGAESPQEVGGQAGVVRRLQNEGAAR